MGDGEGPGAVNIGDEVRGPSGDPHRLGSGEHHRQQPRVLTGLDGDPQCLVERVRAVPPTAGGEYADDGQGAGLGVIGDTCGYRWTSARRRSAAA
jgi:hypothetical protein